MKIQLLKVDFCVKYKFKTRQEHARGGGGGGGGGFNTFYVKVSGDWEKNVSRWLSECPKRFPFELF